MTFFLGDRVSAYQTNYQHIPDGLLGTIVEEGDYSVGVQWDRISRFMHNCSGNCPENTGYYVSQKALKKSNTLAPPKPKPLSTQEKVLAKMKQLDDKFKSGTLRKVQVTKLPLGK